MNVLINGFGRIGRLVYRLLSKQDEIKVVAINDLAPPITLGYLLEFDSAQGIFANGQIVIRDNSIFINEKELKVLSIKDPEELPLKELGIDIVIEATGIFRTKEKASKHLKAGAKKVIISAPAGSDVKTIVYNVNHTTLNKDDELISCASCTTNCLAPIVDVLHKHFKIINGLMTTIHSVTNDQRVLDLPHKDLRRGRSSLVNLIPTTTGAAAAIGLVIPELKGKLDGFAIRTPTVTGSIVDLTVEVEKSTSVEEVNTIMKQSTNESLAYLTQPIVSSDLIGSTFGSLFDPLLTRVLVNNNHILIKVGAWYDNEMSYVSQLVRTLEYLKKI